MNFLHADFHGSRGDIALVTLDCQANVMLLSESEFSAYKRGQRFSYCGGWASGSPVRLTAPGEGHWHVVVDLGGYAGTIKASVRIVRKSSAVNF